MVNFKIVLFETVALPRAGFSLGPKGAHSAALLGLRQVFFQKTTKCFAENYRHNFSQQVNSLFDCTLRLRRIA
jgi:hypothetical protein